MIKKTVQDINEYVGTTVNPLNTPDTMYELYSVPSFDSAYPEVLLGSEIGSSKVTVEENDVLVCKINPRINRVWIVKHNTEHQLIASSEWVIIRSPKNDARYLCYYFQSPTFRTYINSGLTGIGGSLTRAQPKQIAKYPVPIPDIDTQHSIADKLDKLQSIITHRKQQLAKLDELVKARFVEMFGDPELNPYNFEVEKLKNTCDVMTGNTPSRAKPEYYGDYIEWIKTDNIIPNLLYPTKAVECLSKSGSKIGRIVDSNSILMVCIAGSISSIGRVCITNRKIAFNQQINAISSDKYDILFLYILLKLSKTYLVSEINMSLKGILSKSKLEEKEFIVPPIELQTQFADFVKQVDKSKVAVQKALDEAQLLFDSLMQEYFG